MKHITAKAPQTARNTGASARSQNQPSTHRGHSAFRSNFRTISAGRGNLPTRLRSGLERLSGLPMNDVRVHYNSNQPKKYGAEAFARGRNIYLGRGQNRHLAHEAWHIVQQKQGRVRPTTTVKGAAVNDDARLESEATSMGNKAMSLGGRAKMHNRNRPSARDLKS